MNGTFVFTFLMLVAFASVECRAQGYDSEATGIVAPAGELRTARAAHTATTLANGKVLVIGGFGVDTKSIDSVELFDPASKTFSDGGRMRSARSSHTATLLRDGRVLIAGGYDGDYLDSAEIYDPATGSFKGIGKMTMPRSDHAAVLLSDGRVLLAGGVGIGWTFLADAELFDPATGTFSKTGSMNLVRESHTTTLLNDGRVLITGGHRGRRSAIVIYTEAEIYDPRTGKFSVTGNLGIRRHKHDAALLADGRVLIVGGSDERDSRGAYSSVEIFDPKTSRFSPVGDMKRNRYKLQGTSIGLADGRVLIAGGSSQMEIFDPKSNSFSLVPGELGATRLFATVARLSGGRVLIAGGYDERTRVSRDARVYEPMPPLRAANPSASFCRFVSRAEATRILGGVPEDVRMSESTRADGDRTECEFKLNPRVVFYFLIIKSPTDDMAKRLHDEIWNSNKDHAGVELGTGVGDGSYSHVNRPNFLFFAARSGKFNVRLKVNKPIHGTSLEEMERTAKRIIGEINEEKESTE
ncbi:MAG: hypothetical protein IPJ30_08460 [Acidobacteria bacterium]|nr:hypothetical protein [Acidobacteriota bacterium]